jgi:hypothetical protein
MFSKLNYTKIFLVAFLLALVALVPVSAQTYAQQAAALSCPPPTASAPVWGKLVISGDVVTCYYATGTATPTAWTQIGQPQTIGFLNNPLLVGIFITAHDCGALSTGTIDNLSITPAPTYRLQDQDIGAPALMGSANLMGSVWTITGSGADIWLTSDQFNFQPWLVWGDCTVICRITSLSTTGDPWEKIGIMVRDGFNSGSDYAMFCATHAQGVTFQYRTAFNDNPDSISYVAAPAPGSMSAVAIGMGITGNFQGPYVLRP